MKSFMICTLHQNYSVIQSGRKRSAGHVARMKRGEVLSGFRRGNLRKRDNLKNLGIDMRKKY
jgi:hypothetical protein